MKDLNDLPDILLERIKHFFEHYKDLEPNKWVKIDAIYGADKAHELIEASIKRYQESRL